MGSEARSVRRTRQRQSWSMASTFLEGTAQKLFPFLPCNRAPTASPTHSIETGRLALMLFIHTVLLIRAVEQLRPLS